MSTVAPRLTLEQARDAWPRVTGYLNAATLGVPPRTVVEAMTADLRHWAAGEVDAVRYDDDVARCRELFAGLVRVPPSWVATGANTSVMAALVASALPDRAEVVVPHGDFTSIVFPFLVQANRGVRVRHVPLAGLAEAVTSSTTLVAWSLAQSADGVVADHGAVVEAARQHGAMTLCDLTQAVGWMPCDASVFDVAVCTAYKWLCHPRGAAYLTVRPHVADRISPLQAGWYAGESRWDSCYGPDMQLAGDARRFDVSPAWLSWVGAVPAMELFAGLDPEQARTYDAGLADALLERLGLAPQGRAVVSLPDPFGALKAALTDKGATVAGRAGRVRIAFHLWNDEDDVELAAAALTSTGLTADLQ
ncbi:MAG: aminotransferase class V-fold PLP-dependent enzyme [Actinomycetales bacterium]